jgi:hypothetical protein
MPRLSVWFIRASLVYLVIGFTFGAFMLANEGLAFNLPLGKILPAHMEFLFLGFMLQLALGVAYWILPRYGQGKPRGNETLAWASLIMLNAGILMVALNTILMLPWFTVLGRVLEAGCALLFLWGAWRRVRPSG